MVDRKNYKNAFQVLRLSFSLKPTIFEIPAILKITKIKKAGVVYGK
jgi:hypothetical protein